MRCAFGVDVGGTTTKIGLITEDGRIEKRWEIPTRITENAHEVLPYMGGRVTAILTGLDPVYEVCGIGVGLPGPVDEAGRVLTSANLHWKQPIDAIRELQLMFPDLPVQVANDANAAALGEAWMGAGSGARDMVMVTLGTGIGGGVIHEGRIVTGVNGAAGEIGHICVNPKEVISCNCGRCGCLEQYASATGVVRLAQEVLGASKEPSLLRQQSLSAKSVWDAVKEGDALAIQVAETFGYYLGWGLSMVAGVINPEAFVIGGGMSKAGNLLLSYVEKNYRTMALSACSNASVKLATLGNDAGMLGAAKLVLDLKTE